MPKGKRKSKNDRPNKSDQASDSDSTFDAASVVSGFSDSQSIAEENTSDVEDQTQIEAFEERLIESIDGLTQKSAQGRTQSFENLSKGLVKKYIPEFVFERRLTLTDCIERSLKRGRGAELSAAAGLLPLLCVQLGASDASEALFKDLRPLLVTLAADGSQTPSARAKACWALSLAAFLAGGEMADVIELMQTMQAVFQGSYLKGDGQQNVVTAEVAGLHASALNSWNLLLTLMSPGDVYQLWNCSNNFSPTLAQLSELLESPHLEIRLAAGEAFALTFELGRIFSDDFASHSTAELVTTLRKLATDSHKYRAKKDRKQQRASFRDVLHYIEDDLFTEVQVRFAQEALVLDSWARRKQYEVLCQTLHSGLNLHLAENDLLREIFQLGAAVVKQDCHGVKQSKLERHLMNAANFKARTISRSKNRDKRSAVLAC